MKKLILLLLLLTIASNLLAQDEYSWKASSILSKGLRAGKIVVYAKDKIPDSIFLHEIYREDLEENNLQELNLAKFIEVTVLSNNTSGVQFSPSIYVASNFGGLSFKMQSHPDHSSEHAENKIINKPYFLRNGSNWVLILDDPFGEVDLAVNELKSRSVNLQEEKIYQIYKGLGAFKVVENKTEDDTTPLLSLIELSDLEKILLRRNSGSVMSQAFISTLATPFGKNLARELVDPGCANGFLDTGEQCDDNLFRAVDITQHGAGNLECNNCVLSVKEYCGNGSCDLTTENSNNCPIDCNCTAKPCETDGSYNCAVSLSGNECVYDCASCPQVVCGDNVCSSNAGENKNTCAKDCGCPEVKCPEGETGSCSSSYNDYTEMCETACSCEPIITPPVAVCGNKQCESGEDCKNCKLDCGECPSECGDKICGCGELSPYLISAPCVKGSTGECDEASAEGCLAESIKICESSSVTCVMGEATINGKFKDGRCEYDTSTCMTTNTPSSCGNAICDSDESCESCVSDCGLCPESSPTSFCGNGSCDNGEDCTTCTVDCGTCANTEGYCGDGMCSVAEQNNWYSCTSDCNYTNSGEPTATCGNGSCEPGEDCTNCQIDCGSCTITEDANTGGFCGDGGCDSSTESCTTCPNDCGECLNY